jgi:regulation of enolase protein 1 (concanavalin A-like superfamily)
LKLSGLLVMALIMVPLAMQPRGQATTPSAAFIVTKFASFSTQVMPGDFNRDGRLDLVGGLLKSDGSEQLMLATGRGDGTFNAAKSLGRPGSPLAVADLNKDGKPDIIYRSFPGVSVLPGNGDGTFGTPRRVAPADSSFAVVADFNADTQLDVAVNAGVYPDIVGVAIYPGNGDFTFAPRMVVPLGDTGSQPVTGVVANLNSDSRPDLALNTVGSVWTVINDGGLLFSAHETPVNDDSWDIAAADLNRDGKTDVVVTNIFEPSSFSDPPQGKVIVLLGKGDGTFQPKATYDTGVAGEHTLVVGDFTRDGIIDVATGNLSRHYDDDFGPQMWDSISVLRGDGAGHLGQPVSFALGNVNGEGYRDTQNHLAVGDFNGDGQLDLVSSPSATLINIPAAPNRRPVVSAGPDKSYPFESNPLVCAMASDPDGHWLTYNWAEGSTVVATAPCKRFGGLNGDEPGTHTYTVTVNDGQGGVASDSVTVTVSPSGAPTIYIETPVPAETVPVDVPYTLKWNADSAFTRFDVSYSLDNGRLFQPITECAALPGSTRQCVWQHPGPATAEALIRVVGRYGGSNEWIAISSKFLLVVGPRTSLPSGWYHGDFGAVGAAGNATFDGTTFTVTGSGADIWGTADEFHYAFSSSYYDFDFTARVVSVQNVQRWVKAGVMVRSDYGAGSPHSSIFATPTTEKGVAAQGRVTENGLSSQSAQVFIAPPVWLRASRRGGTIYTAYRKSLSDPWTAMPSVAAEMWGPVSVGLAVSSHVDGRLATAKFDNVTFDDSPLWRNQDIGAVGLAGRKLCCTDLPAHRTLEGSGTDIWGTADAFHYEYAQWYGDGTITAHVLDVENTHAWAKAGVMFRETLDATSKQVMAIVSPGKGVAMQYRPATGGASAQAAVRSGHAPAWVRLTRAGNTFTSAVSSDGVTWTTLGTATVAMSPDIFVGLPVTSHNNGTLATADFDDVSVRH